MISPTCRLVLGMLAGLLAAPLAASETPNARAWIERMAAAIMHMDYQGTFVYMRGEQMETLRITHVVKDDGVHERLYSVAGPHREIIRDADTVRTVLADGGSIIEEAVVSGAIFPEFPVGEPEGASEYRFETGGKARIAGHQGRRVTVVPKDEFRYGYDLWLEAQTGLLLKWVLFDSEQRELAKLVFTELRLGDEVDPDELISTTPPEAFVEMETPLAKRQMLSNTEPEWKPDSLPPGYRLTTHRHQSGGNGTFEHLVYSDGLASVSVYIESKQGAPKVNSGLSRIGTAHAFKRDLGERQVIVIGEVPPATVRAIGDAFRVPQMRR